VPERGGGRLGRAGTLPQPDIPQAVARVTVGSRGRPRKEPDGHPQFGMSALGEYALALVCSGGWGKPCRRVRAFTGAGAVAHLRRDVTHPAGIWHYHLTCRHPKHALRTGRPLRDVRNGEPPWLVKKSTADLRPVVPANSLRKNMSENHAVLGKAGWTAVSRGPIVLAPPWEYHLYTLPCIPVNRDILTGTRPGPRAGLSARASGPVQDLSLVDKGWDSRPPTHRSPAHEERGGRGSTSTFRRLCSAAPLDKQYFSPFDRPCAVCRQVIIAETAEKIRPPVSDS